ncbi:TetR/AcrR family transcriptional regulator [Chondrinema litorale]|uniref:TetR/AcrR family transcriptional regulator n=1 Tax=Chondrinema litorale TaxID=2994555 RepID=UPI002542D45F|nr:TetR/AcrR family transcriptional regulator [Chondrinema litorale]UZR97129.1 TetR/AcrR family transcriptional regulator [Chondrinema litorale]
MKSKILQIALEHFLKNGLKGVSVQKLVAPIGISTKTVYKYFTSKETLIEAALYEYHKERYTELLNLIQSQKPVCAFFEVWKSAFDTEHKVNKAFFEDLHYYYPELAKRIESDVKVKFKAQFLDLIRKALLDGSFRQGLIPELVLSGIFMLYNSIIRDDQFKNSPYTKDDILGNSIGVFIRGLCTEEGLNAIQVYMRMKKDQLKEK